MSAENLERVIDEVRRLDPCGEMFGTTDRVKDPLNSVSGLREAHVLCDKWVVAAIAV